MNTATSRSLHHLVEKWLAPTPSTRIRDIRVGRMQADGGRYVHVEASSRNGPRGFFFFRHVDGCWRVFPPRLGRPTMNGYAMAALL